MTKQTKLTANDPIVKACFDEVSQRGQTIGLVRKHVNRRTKSFPAIAERMSFILLDCGESDVFITDQDSTQWKAYKVLYAALRTAEGELHADGKPTIGAKVNKKELTVTIGVKGSRTTSNESKGSADASPKAAPVVSLKDAEETIERFSDKDKAIGLDSILRQLERLGLTVEDLMEHAEKRAA